MSLFESLGLAALLARRALGAFVRPSVWSPMILVTILQLVALTLIVLFHHRFWAGTLTPVIEALGGSEATHYPDHFYRLARIMRRVDVVISVLAGSLAVGATTVRIAGYFGHEQRRGGWAASLARAPHLFGLALLSVSLIETAVWLFASIPEDFRYRSPIVRLGLMGAELGMGVILTMVFAFATAWIVLRRRNLLGAVGRSIRLAWETLVPLGLLVTFAAVALFPFSVVLHQMDLSQTELPPEGIIGIVLGRILVELLVRVFLVGSVTGLFLWRGENR